MIRWDEDLYEDGPEYVEQDGEILFEDGTSLSIIDPEYGSDIYDEGEDEVEVGWDFLFEED